jgi:hypothetical protein
MTNTEEAVSAIEAQHQAGGDRVRINPSIAESVYASLEQRHQHMFRKLGRLSILARVIVDSTTRLAPIPEPMEDAMPSPGAVTGRADGDEVQRHNDEVQRAADRLRQLRKELGQF